MDGQHMDPDKEIYEFSCSSVKSGHDTDQATYDRANDFEHCGDKYAISNFALCIDDAFWQADFGTGQAPTLYTKSSERDGYGEDTDGVGDIDRELITAGVDGPSNGTENPSYPQDVDGVTALPGATGETDFDLSAEDGSLVDDDPSPTSATRSRRRSRSISRRTTPSSSTSVSGSWPGPPTRATSRVLRCSTASSSRTTPVITRTVRSPSAWNCHRFSVPVVPPRRDIFGGVNDGRVTKSPYRPLQSVSHLDGPQNRLVQLCRPHSLHVAQHSGVWTVRGWSW